METSGTKDTKAGPIVVHLFMAERGSMTYMIGYSDHPDEIGLNPELLLDGGRDGALKTFPGATLLSEERITLNGYPGRDIVIAFPESVTPKGGSFRIKFYRAQQRLYQVGIVQTATGPLVGENAFFDSFRMLAP